MNERVALMGISIVPNCVYEPTADARYLEKVGRMEIARASTPEPFTAAALIARLRKLAPDTVIIAGNPAGLPEDYVVEDNLDYPDEAQILGDDQARRIKRPELSGRMALYL